MGACACCDAEATCSGHVERHGIIVDLCSRHCHWSEQCQPIRAAPEVGSVWRRTGQDGPRSKATVLAVDERGIKYRLESDSAAVARWWVASAAEWHALHESVP